MMYGKVNGVWESRDEKKKIEENLIVNDEKGNITTESCKRE